MNIKSKKLFSCNFDTSSINHQTDISFKLLTLLIFKNI